MLRKLLFPTLLSAFLLPSCDSASGQDENPGDEPAKVYHSTAVIQVLPPPPPIHGESQVTENYINNEIASMGLGKITDQVAEKVEGVEADDLNEMLSIWREEGTDLVNLSAVSLKEGQPKEVLEHLISSYIATRSSVERGRDKELLASYDHELWVQTEVVQSRRKDFTVLIQQYGIPYFSEKSNVLGEIEIDQLASAREQLNELEIESALLNAERELSGRTEAETEELKKKLKLIELKLREVRKLVGKRQDEAIKLTLNQHEYELAKDAYEQAKEVHNEMRSRQQEARIAIETPRRPIIIRQAPR